MKLHVDYNWLRSRIESDPDVETDAGRAVRSSKNVMSAAESCDAAAFAAAHADSKLGLLIHQTRRLKQLTIAQLADQVRIDPEEVKTIEADPSYTPMPRTVHKIAKFVNVPPRSLLNLLPGAAANDVQLEKAVERFAASSDDLSKLSRSERRQLNDFVKFLVTWNSEKS